MRLIHKKSFIAFVFVALILFSLLGVGVGGKVYADTSTSGFSYVLDDLQKDESFNPDDYPAVNDDYSLQVIQVAESTSGEVFIYVYQPSGKGADLRATQINMALTESLNDVDGSGNGAISGGVGVVGGGAISGGLGVGISGESAGGGTHGVSAKLSLYDLTFLTFNGVFYKYKVKNFEVSTNAIRYYNITSIFRKWSAQLDEPPVDGQTVNFVSFKVGKLFTVCTSNGNVVYGCSYIETIAISEKYVGFIRYPNGYKFCAYSCDAHYVAFTTDRPMDKLYEVDIEYIKQTRIREYLFTGLVSDSIKEPEKVIPPTLKYNYVVSNSPTGIGQKKYTWNRIERIDTFKAGLENDNINLDDTANAGLQGKEWVLRFAETDYIQSPITNGYQTDQSCYVSEVTLLRLKFEYDGKVYNLGVVDNKQTGRNDPDNPTLPGVGDDKSLLDKIIDFFVKVWNFLKQLNWWHLLLIGLGVIVVIVLIVCLIKFGIKAVFKVIWLVISAPFRFIGWIFKKIRSDD